MVIYKIINFSRTLQTNTTTFIYICGLTSLLCACWTSEDKRRKQHMEESNANNQARTCEFDDTKSNLYRACQFYQTIPLLYLHILTSHLPRNKSQNLKYMTFL